MLSRRLFLAAAATPRGAALADGAASAGSLPLPLRVLLRHAAFVRSAGTIRYLTRGLHGRTLGADLPLSLGQRPAGDALGETAAGSSCPLNSATPICLFLASPFFSTACRFARKVVFHICNTCCATTASWRADAARRGSALLPCCCLHLYAASPPVPPAWPSCSLVVRLCRVPAGCNSSFHRLSGVPPLTRTTPAGLAGWFGITRMRGMRSLRQSRHASCSASTIISFFSMSVQRLRISEEVYEAAIAVAGSLFFARRQALAALAADRDILYRGVVYF